MVSSSFGFHLTSLVRPRNKVSLSLTATGGARGWGALQPGLGHHAASGTQGEAGSTQTLWIEGVGRLVSQRKARVLLPEGGETDAEQEKRKTAVRIRHAASSHARHRRDPSHRTALGTISASCGPFPHSTVIYLQSTCSATETGLGRLWRFRNDRERPLGRVRSLARGQAQTR